MGIKQPKNAKLRTLCLTKKKGFLVLMLFSAHFKRLSRVPYAAFVLKDIFVNRFIYYILWLVNYCISSLVSFFFSFNIVPEKPYRLLSWFTHKSANSLL